VDGFISIACGPNRVDERTARATFTTRAGTTTLQTAMSRRWRCATIIVLLVLAIGASSTCAQNRSDSDRDDRGRFDRGDRRSSQRDRSSRYRESTTAPADRGPITGTSWDSYAVIEQRNLFVRERPREQPPPQEREEPAPVERSIVLRGVAQRDGSYVAFFEDLRDGTTTAVREGSPVARGTIRNVSLSSADYVTQQATITVGVGNNLENVPLASTAPSITPTGASSPTSDIEQRLRQRRLQELGR
jgi:hypothetical protein